jgi:hypothetical protein
MKSKNFWKWISNIKMDNVKNMHTDHTWIVLVFTLNVVVIYLAPKEIHVSCDDNVVELS